MPISSVFCERQCFVDLQLDVTYLSFQHQKTGKHTYRIKCCVVFSCTKTSAQGKRTSMIAHCKKISNCVQKSIFKKVTKLRIWIFAPKINELLSFWYIVILLDFEFSRQKLTIFKDFQLLLIFYWHKITIFGVKI